MSDTLLSVSFSPRDRKTFGDLVQNIYEGDFERTPEMIQLHNLMKKYGFDLETLRKNPEWLLGVLPQNIDAVKALQVELADEKDEKFSLKADLAVLQQEKDRLQARLDWRHGISEKFAPLSKHAKPLSKVVTTPLYYLAYAAAGPLSVAIHRYADPCLFQRDDPHDLPSAIWRPVVATAAGIAFWTAANVADYAVTNHHVNQQVETALENIPCTAEGNKAGPCDSVHIPFIPYYLPFLPASGEGLGPYTLERSLEVKTEQGVADSGIKGISICHQYTTYLRDAFERVDESAEIQPSRTIHPWDCHFDPI